MHPHRDGRPARRSLPRRRPDLHHPHVRHPAPAPLPPERAPVINARQLRIAALVAAVTEHAETPNEDGGWDVVVECYDDDEIAEVIGRAFAPIQSWHVVTESESG